MTPPTFDTDEEVRRWNKRAEYLRACSAETVLKILRQATRLQEVNPNTTDKAALDVAVHQQMQLDWMEQHPRDPVQKALLDLAKLPEAERARITQLILESESVRRRNPGEAEDDVTGGAGETPGGHQGTGGD